LSPSVNDGADGGGGGGGGRSLSSTGKKHVMVFCQAGISLGCIGFPPEYLSKMTKK